MRTNISFLFLEKILFKVLQSHKNIPVGPKRRLRPAVADLGAGRRSLTLLPLCLHDAAPWFFCPKNKNKPAGFMASVGPDGWVQTRTVTLTLRVRPHRCSQFLSSLPVFIYTASIVPVSWRKIFCSGISCQRRQTPPTFSDLHTNPVSQTHSVLP